VLRTLRWLALSALSAVAAACLSRFAKPILALTILVLGALLGEPAANAASPEPAIIAGASAYADASVQGEAPRPSATLPSLAVSDATPLLVEVVRRAPALTGGPSPRGPPPPASL
jgi:hypothetical protein